MIDVVGLGVAIAALLVTMSLHRRVVRLPSRLWSLARDEIEKGRAHDDARAEEALREAVAERAERLLSGLREHHEKSAADLRVQLGAAEARARAAERASADITTALETATTLVRELRAMLDERARAASRARAPVGAKVSMAEAADDDDERATIDIGLPRLDDGDDEPEELTQVAQRPVAGTSGAPNGLRLRQAIPPPPSSTRKVR
jgi:hypothetical protein